MQCLFLQIQFYQNKFSKYQCIKWSCRRCILFLFFFSLPGNACGVKAAKKVIDPWPRKRWQKIHPALVQEREDSLNGNIIGDFLGKRILIKYHTWKTRHLYNLLPSSDNYAKNGSETLVADVFGFFSRMIYVYIYIYCNGGWALFFIKCPAQRYANYINVNRMTRVPGAWPPV